MKTEVISRLREITGALFVLDQEEQKQAYYYDEIEVSLRPPADPGSVVVKPADSAEIAAVVRLAARERIPVVVRGGGTGLCGGAIPIHESIIISMERLKRIIEIDTGNMMATVEAGVTLAEFLEKLEEYPGVGFPVHPGDEGAQMGGMVVTNAGGARAVRHGIMRNHIKGIEVVLASGEILNLGGKLLKDNAGYNLMHLMMGSEGTLGIVTKVTLRIYPEEKYSASLVVSFPEVEQASQAVLKVLGSGVAPLAVEYQDRRLNQATAELLGLHWPLTKGNADLIFILSEKSEEALYDGCEIIDRICDEHAARESFIACSHQEQADVLAIRSGSYEVIKDEIYHSFDMAVPPAAMPEFLKQLWQLCEEYHTHTNITAHIADGNVHNDILLRDGKAPDYHEEMRDRMYQICFALGGTITGEHGIGKLRVADLRQQKSETELDLMRGIKTLFDPENILNPGTVL